MVLLAACTSLGPLSLNLYLPSIPAVQSHFGATVAEVQATVSLALLAFGLGLVLLGPLTDRFGRRPCLIGGLAMFLAGSLVAAFTPSLQVLALARVLQSVGCAISFISARAMVSDVSPRDELARSVAQMTMIMLVVQMVAPLLGNLIMTAGGWRAIQYFGVALSLALLAPEPGTRSPNSSSPPSQCCRGRVSPCSCCRPGCSIRHIPHSCPWRPI